MNLQKSSEHTTLGLAAFALIHTGCGDAMIETRPDERSVACWCVRCGEVCVFEGEQDWQATKREAAWPRRRWRT